MLGMHLARLQIDPDIKSKGMVNSKKMVLFASSEVRNTYMIINPNSHISIHIQKEPTPTDMDTYI